MKEIQAAPPMSMKINPDIFGSMIQAVAEDEERRALGMHYTSVAVNQKLVPRKRV